MDAKLVLEEYNHPGKTDPLAVAEDVEESALEEEYGLQWERATRDHPYNR
jgi:hypothetical protein